MHEYSLEYLNHDELKEFYGVENKNVKFLEELFGCEIISRGDLLKTDYSETSIFDETISLMIDYIKKGNVIDENFIKHIYLDLKDSIDTSWNNITAITTYQGKPIKYKTYNQYKFALSVNNNDVVFSIGPAGTGKTFLAVLLACKALKEGKVKKIILTRPAVEAGESLGFLPGDLKEKIDPYLMPLYDSLYDILGEEQVLKLIEKNLIEVIPLAYMRGRTLNDAFIILDEAQNTTEGQMLMFLTRLGYNSKMLVNGDITQIDLNIRKTKSGLVAATNKLVDIKGIEFIEFSKSDVVRNPLVERIIEKFNI